MSPWELLIDDAALASWIPDEHARYRAAVGGALAWFLSGLSNARQSALLAEQMTLPAAAPHDLRLAKLAAGCPALHKLGQVLARDRRLSPSLRGHLQELESLPPSTPLEPIAAILTEDLGPLERLGFVLQPPALAEASVAVVVPFWDCWEGVEGVFKVLKPGVVEALEEDLERLESVGTYLDERCEAFGIPTLDYAEAFSQVREKLRQEIRLDLEQAYLQRAGRDLADDPRLRIPGMIERGCSPRITAMERVRGVKVTAAPASRRLELTRAIVDALVARPVFDRSAEVLFHGDPHAGNLFATEDHRLALLDWSLVGTLGRREREGVVQILRSALLLDAPGVAFGLSRLASGGRIDEAALTRVADRRLRSLREGRFPGFDWLTGLLDEAVGEAGLRVAADLLLFRKAVHTLEGVVADLGSPGRNAIDLGLAARFALAFAAEWPERWRVPFASRDFGTRLSNADLAGFWLSLPMAAARYWAGLGLDLLGPPTSGNDHA